MKDISGIADQAAGAHAMRDDERVKCLHKEAIAETSCCEAAVAFVHGFARVAGRARRDHHDHAVCRLRHGAEGFRLIAGMTKQEFRMIWVANGAAGWKPPVKPKCSYSMLALTRG